MKVSLLISTYKLTSYTVVIINIHMAVYRHFPDEPDFFFNENVWGVNDTSFTGQKPFVHPTSSIKELKNARHI